MGLFKNYRYSNLKVSIKTVEIFIDKNVMAMNSSLL